MDEDRDENPKRMTEDKEVEPKEEPDGLRMMIRPEKDIEKRSRYCRHGNVWGRCPHGC